MSDEERDKAVRLLLGKTWAELEAIEFQGRLLFPAELRRYKTDGSLHVEKILLRVPRSQDLRRARTESRKLAIAAKLDLDRDKDLIEGLENLVILHEAIRSPDKPPHEPLVGDPLELERDWDNESLTEVFGKLETLRALLDPAPANMTQEQTLEVVARIATEQSIAPLAGYGPFARARYTVSTASLLWHSLTSKSSSASDASSTQAQ